MLLRPEISEMSSLISPKRSSPSLRQGCPAWDDFHRAVHKGSQWPEEDKTFLPSGYPYQDPPQVLTQGYLLLEVYRKHIILGNWRFGLKSTHVPVSRHIPTQNTEIKPHSLELRNICTPIILKYCHTNPGYSSISCTPYHY